MMEDLAAYLEIGLVGADIHIPINLHGIGAYDLRAKDTSELKGHMGFPDTRWSRNEDNPRP
jgi:hypothetical protein